MFTGVMDHIRGIFSRGLDKPFDKGWNGDLFDFESEAGYAKRLTMMSTRRGTEREIEGRLTCSSLPTCDIRRWSHDTGGRDFLHHAFE